MSQFKYLLFIVLIAYLHSSVAAQEKFYLMDANEIRDYCWKNNELTKKEYVVPEKWKNESAINHYLYNFYECKTTRSGKAISFLYMKKIKIQDKVALDDFSELYFNMGSHGGYQYYQRQKNFMGFRVIKPDGRIVVVNDEDIYEEKGQKKVAIKNLEVGDELEYYLYTYDYCRDVDLYAVIDRFALRTIYPVTNFEYRIQTDENWKVEFGSGCDEITMEMQKSDDKKSENYDFIVKQDTIEPIASQLWMYPFQHLPYLNIYVRWKENYHQSADAEDFISDVDPHDVAKRYQFSLYAYKGKDEWADFNSYLKRNNKQDLSSDEQIREFYYFLRHIKINMHLIYDIYNNNMPRVFSKNDFLEMSRYAADQLYYPYDVCATIPRHRGKLENIVDINELYRVVHLSGNYSVFYFEIDPFTRFNSIPPEFENASAYKIDERYSTDGRAPKIIALATSLATDNIQKVESKIKLNFDDEREAEITNTTEYSGHFIDLYLSSLVDWPQMIFDENEYYGTKKWGDLSKAKSRMVEDLTAFYDSEANKLKERREKYVEGEFQVEDITLSSFKVLSTGNSVNDTSLKVSFNCSIPEKIKKIGPNYILKIGELVGSQVNLDEKDLVREFDIDMDFPRTFDYSLTIDVPEGYTPFGIDELINNIDNETGTLQSSAEFRDGVLTIRFFKQYKSNYVPKDQWELMKEFLIPASDFNSKEILFKKI